MNEIVDKYSAYGLRLAAQYESGQVAFADLAGLIEEFAAEFTEQLNGLPEPQRAPVSSALETSLDNQLKAVDKDGNTAQALNEILLTFNRTPIY